MLMSMHAFRAGEPTSSISESTSLVVVHDVGTVVLHRQDDAIVLGDLGQLAEAIDHEPAAVAFPVAVLIVSVGLVIGCQPVVDRNPPPGSKDLAQRRPDITRPT